MALSNNNDRLKRNISRMVQGGASEQEIDAYMQSEKVTPIKDFVGGMAEKSALGQGLQILGDTAKGTAQDLGQMVSNIPASAGRYVGDIAQAVSHPIETAKGLGKVALGGVQKLIPNEQGQEVNFNAVIDMYKDKYGSIDNAREQIINNPVEFASDVASLLGGAGGAVGATGKLANAPKLAKAGATVAKFGAKMEPMAMAGKALGAGLGKVTELAPYKKSLNPQAVQASKALDVDVPASALTNSRVAPLAETFAGKSIFGDKFVQKLSKANEKLQDIADDMVKKTGGTGDSSLVGQQVENSFNAYHKNFISQKNKLYDDAVIGTDVIVDPKGTKAVAELIMKDKELASGLLGKAKDKSVFANIIDRISGKGDDVPTGVLDKQGLAITKTVAPKPITGKELKSAISELNEQLSSTDAFVTGNKAKLRKLTATMAEDLDSAIVAQKPELGQALTQANDFYKKGLETLNSSYGKSIKKLSDAKQYDKIIPAIIKPSMSADDIPRIMEIIGETGKANVQASLLTDIFNGARKGTRFTPQGITSQINKLGIEKLQKIFTPEQLKTLTDIDTLTQGMGKLSKVMDGSQTLPLARFGAQIGAFGISKALGIKLLVGDIVFTKLIGSKTGQALLGEGIDLSSVASKGKTVEKIANQLKTKPSAIRQAGVISEETQ